MATFEETFRQVARQLWQAGAASRDAEVEALKKSKQGLAWQQGHASRDSEVAELRAPMECGHPKACEKEITVYVEPGVPSTHYICTACAETADLRSKIEAVRAVVKSGVIRARVCDTTKGPLDFIDKWADELETALGKQGEGQQ